MRPLYLISIVTSLAFLACKKDRNSTNSSNLADTLTTGWTKKVVSLGTFFGDIVFSNSMIGYVTGAKTYKSIDSGKTWILINSLTETITNLAITNDNKLFLVSPNSLNSTIDNGLTFTRLQQSGNYSEVIFIDNNNGFCVSPRGTIIKSTDGGVTWKQITPLNGLINRNTGYATACFLSTSSGIISIGDSIYKSANDLSTWSSIKVPSIIGGNSNNSISLYSINPTTIYAGAWNGKILKSVNGGSSFELKFSLPNFTTYINPYLDIHFIDTNLGYACFGNRIYKTTDGGSNWQSVVALANSTILEIHFTDANHGWGCTDKGEVLTFRQ